MKRDILKHKKSILIISGYYYPAFKAGGPIQSLISLVAYLKKDYDVTVVAEAYDIDGTVLKVTTNEICQNDGYKIIYTDSTYSAKDFKGFLKSYNYDFIYLNSFFSWRHAIRIIGILYLSKAKIIMAPRGQLSPGALAINNKIKGAYLTFFKAVFKKKIYRYHATSELEYRHIKAKLNIKEDQLFLAQNLKDIAINNDAFFRTNKNIGSLKLVNISRISPKKNLAFALDILRNVPSGVSLDIYGPVEDKNYWNECLIIARKMPDGVSVNYKGDVKPEDVIKTLNQYDAFFFPTKGENFGHVIMEALIAGLPLIISNETPFINLQDQNVGWDIPLKNKELYIKVIAELLKYDSNDIYTIKKGIYDFLQQYVKNNDANLIAYLNLFS